MNTAGKLPSNPNLTEELMALKSTATPPGNAELSSAYVNFGPGGASGIEFKRRARQAVFALLAAIAAYHGAEVAAEIVRGLHERYSSLGTEAFVLEETVIK